MVLRLGMMPAGDVAARDRHLALPIARASTRVPVEPRGRGTLIGPDCPD
jgi:hypothetical protein